MQPPNRNALSMLNAQSAAAAAGNASIHHLVQRIQLAVSTGFLNPQVPSPLSIFLLHFLHVALLLLYEKMERIQIFLHYLDAFFTFATIRIPFCDYSSFMFLVLIFPRLFFLVITLENSRAVAKLEIRRRFMNGSKVCCCPLV